GTISTNLSGTKDVARQEVKKDVSSLRYVALSNWAHDALLEFSSSKPQDHCSTEVPEGSGNLNPTTSTSNPPADQMETLTVETPIPTINSPVLTAYSTDSQEPSRPSQKSDNWSYGYSNSNQEQVQIVEPKKIFDALQDLSWVETMQEELLQFKIQNVWTLIDCPKGEEGIDYDEVFTHVARIDAIRLFLAYASFMGFTVYQMDVKSAFFYATIDEEVYVMQPPVFQDPEFPAKVYKVEKAMYGLRQAPRAWNQVTPKEYHLHAVKRIFRYLKGHPKLGLWYPKESPFDLVAYSDSDYGSATQDRKSTTEGCQFLGRRLISWQCKKQTIGEHNVDFHSMVDFIEASPLSPSFSGRIVPLFDTILVQQGEGSGTPTEPHHTPSPKALSPSHTTHTSPSLLPVTTTSIPTVTPTETTPIRQYTRRARIAQSSALPTVADVPASPQRDVSQGEACPTDSGFIADQDRATIAKSSTLPYDSAPRVTSPAVVEGSMQQTIPELMALCTSLQRQLFDLTDKFQAQEVEINRLKERGRSMDEGEAATERISDDSEEMATVLTLMDAATVLASGVIDVPTGSGSIPIASTPTEGSVPTDSEEVPTASPVFTTATVVTPVTRRKGKEVMVESKTLNKHKVQEQIDAQVARELEEKLEREDQRRAKQIARDKEVARIHVEEELQSVIDGLDKAERIKRKGLNLEHESAKKQKTSEEVTEEAKPSEEVTEEKVKEMMKLVPIEEVYVEALQVKHHII
nr:ribonuclease H-like domain, reverse transcriptase, RNA-dependent DNA polymerase [Tanacetum cinerariifolium]